MEFIPRSFGKQKLLWHVLTSDAGRFLRYWKIPDLRLVPEKEVETFDKPPTRDKQCPPWVKHSIELTIQGIRLDEATVNGESNHQENVKSMSDKYVTIVILYDYRMSWGRCTRLRPPTIDQGSVLVSS